LLFINLNSVSFKMEMKNVHSHDPFNWPALTRQDLMSLNTITQDKDLFRVKTAVAQ